MKKRGKIWLLAAMAALFLSGCGTDEKPQERREAEFTVVAPDEVPQELAVQIEANKRGEIRMSYTDGGFLYLIRGYGEQKTGGYSISVAECTEDDTTIYLDTRLIGPSNQERLSKEPSWPYLVLKMEAREKEVVIE